MSIDICYIVSHGFASRMLTQTNLLGRLRSEGKTVALIAPDRNDPILSSYCKEYGILLEEFVPKKSFFSEDYLFKRHYFLEDIRANVSLWEKHLAATKYHVARNPLKRIKPHWYYFCYLLIKTFPSIRRRFENSESRHLNSSEVQSLLERLQPKKLISTYPVNLAEAMLLHYGNRCPNIETWIHLLSWDNITCKGRFPEIADRFIAWGPVMRDEFKESYQVSDTRIHVCGVPHFDMHCYPMVLAKKPDVLRALSIDPNKRYLMFAMSSPRFAPREIDIVEWLAKQISAGVFGPIQLLIRPHPQNVQGNMSDATWLPRLQRLEKLNGVAIAYPRLVKSRMRWSMDNVDMCELAAMLSGAAIVLNSGSTISIDALIHARPIIITSFDGNQKLSYWQSASRLIDYPHLKKLIGFGAVTVVKNYDDLSTEIFAYLDMPERKALEREQAVMLECSGRNGDATEKVVAVLIS